ncbi:MAG: hypothetical protein R3F33_12155 [Planctomycetota bacterium]
MRTSVSGGVFQITRPFWRHVWLISGLVAILAMGHSLREARVAMLPSAEPWNGEVLQWPPDGKAFQRNIEMAIVQGLLASMFLYYWFARGTSVILELDSNSLRLFRDKREAPETIPLVEILDARMVDRSEMRIRVRDGREVGVPLAGMGYAQSMELLERLRQASANQASRV